MEVIYEAFQPANLVFTVLLLLVMVYWLMVIVGGLHFHHDIGNVDVGHGDFGHADAGDADVGHADVGHADVGHAELGDAAFGDGDIGDVGSVHVDGVHAEAGHGDLAHDAGHGHDLHVGDSWWTAALDFFHFGQLPLTIGISILVVSLWIFSMVVNHYWAPAGVLVMSTVVLVNFVVALGVLKVTGMPLAKLFELLNRDYNAAPDVVGHLCTVIAAADETRLGQAEVVNPHGMPLLLNVRTVSGKSATVGQKAIVIEKDNQSGVYLIIPSELES